uniref:J domain-containing protein n=1 Tax=Glossina morsitans morsitans TaxID=37546 RepID=A0A1B0FPW6_GLOMM
MFAFKTPAFPLKINVTFFRGLYIKRINLFKKCCTILGVKMCSADPETVRSAYIELVKKVHPDSGQPEASEDRFHEIDEAFKFLQQRFAKNRRGIFDDDDDEVPDIRHTAPQHRHYLSYYDCGPGNPLQRHKQHELMKAKEAQEHLIKHRVDKSQISENSLKEKGGIFANNPMKKTQYGFDRIVEDYIQEAISKGDFDNLSGAGKPLPNVHVQNPYVDFTMHKVNKILSDNGFTPQWIALQRDVREDLKNLKRKFEQERIYFGEYPLTGADLKAWETFLTNCKEDEKLINHKIDEYNLIAPIFERQLFRVDLCKLSDDVLKDPDIPKNQDRPLADGRNDKAINSNESKTDFLGFFLSLF